jgi:thymidine kinase
VAKLYYRYGTVGSAKTLNLLAVAHNYEQQGKRALLIKPALDDRFGRAVIRSRAGLERDTDLLVDSDTAIEAALLEGVDCVLVDEAQFLSEGLVDQLRRITIDPGIPVICYGLRTDFRTDLFAGAKRLLEVADRIEEIKTTCAFCNKKAITNLKLSGGVPTLEGPSIELGTEETYLPACYRCYKEKIAAAAPIESGAQHES